MIHSYLDVRKVCVVLNLADYGRVEFLFSCWYVRDRNDNATKEIGGSAGSYRRAISQYDLWVLNGNGCREVKTRMAQAQTASVRPSVTQYRRLNGLSDFREIRCRS